MSLDYTLPRKSSLSSDSNKTYCMLGHCLPASEEGAKPGARCDMGTMLLFNGRPTALIEQPCRSFILFVMTTHVKDCLHVAIEVFVQILVVASRKECVHGLMYVTQCRATTVVEGQL